MIKRIVAVAFVFVLAAPVCALGEDCTSALVMSTYNRIDISKSDWRLASLVTENEWKKISHDGQLNVVIYGIPVGATYKDFEDRVTEKLNSYSESLTQSQLTNIAWTGLDPNGADAYTQCILASQQGLQMYVNNATKDEVSLKVRWNATGKEPPEATPSWSWNGPKTSDAFPAKLSAGYTIVVVPRPTSTRILAVNFQGHAASLIITEIPPPPPPPDYTYVPCVETYQTPVADGWGIYWSTPVTFCTPSKPDGWTIARLASWTTNDFGTDRNCSSFATCTGQENDTSSRICRTIAVQGHNENRFGGHGRLQGTLIVQWRQKLATGEDPHKMCHDGTALQMF